MTVRTSITVAVTAVLGCQTLLVLDPPTAIPGASMTDGDFEAAATDANVSDVDVADARAPETSTDAMPPPLGECQNMHRLCVDFDDSTKHPEFGADWTGTKIEQVTTEFLPNLNASLFAFHVTTNATTALRRASLEKDMGAFPAGDVTLDSSQWLRCTGLTGTQYANVLGFSVLDSNGERLNAFVICRGNGFLEIFTRVWIGGLENPVTLALQHSASEWTHVRLRLHVKSNWDSLERPGSADVSVNGGDPVLVDLAADSDPRGATQLTAVLLAGLVFEQSETSTPFSVDFDDITFDFR